MFFIVHFNAQLLLFYISIYIAILNIKINSAKEIDDGKGVVGVEKNPYLNAPLEKIFLSYQVE